MTLFLLLLVPVLIGLGGLLLGRGRITIKEFAVQEAVIAVVIVTGYLIALSGRSSDVEHWNGRIAKKWTASGSCCHSYSCNCTTTCSGSGKDRSCSTHCQTCYEHWHDQEFYATTTNQETVFSETCVRPHRAPPERWQSIVEGEPTTVDHPFTNYVQANPDTIMRRTGAADRWKGHLPAYPAVYDYYRSDQAIAVGIAVPRLARLNESLATLNADLGRKKQVNVILVVAAAGDPSYAEAIREAWLGGKKNDLIVVIGTSSFPAITWVSVVSWSEQEEMKLAIRDRIVGLGSFDGDSVVSIVRDEAAAKFKRKRWADFDYLKATVEPTPGVQRALFIVGLLLSLGLAILFYRVDVFDEEPTTTRRTGPWANRNSLR